VHAALAQTPQGVVQQQLQAQIQAMMQMQPHGMFPPPAALKEYEAILPGTFERIMRMAEKAQQDQTDTVVSAQQALQRDTARVHWLAAGISLAAMVGAAYCASIHETIVAGCFLGVPVFAVIKAFIDSLKAPSAKDLAEQQRRALQQQVEQMQQIMIQQGTIKPTTKS
jgi:uncharacterized membrane protein